MLTLLVYILAFIAEILSGFLPILLIIGIMFLLYLLGRIFRLWFSVHECFKYYSVPIIIISVIVFWVAVIIIAM